MNNEQREKYARMNRLLQELDGLNRNIAKLTFYLIYGEDDNIHEHVGMLNEQKYAMIAYRSVLIKRLDKGCY